MFSSYRRVWARKCISASSQYLRMDSVPVSAAPLTMACWGSVPDTASNYPLMILSDEAASADGFLIEMAGANGEPIRAMTYASSLYRIAATSTGVYAANQWVHCCGVFSSTTHRNAYANGIAGTANTQSSTPAGVAYFDIGQTGLGAYHNISVAWPAIWNIALSEPDIALLASGVPPWMVKPESLVACWDFTGCDLEPSIGIYGNAYPLTNFGSTVIEGPAFLKTRQRSRLWLGATQPAGGGGNRRRRMLIAGTR